MKIIWHGKGIAISEVIRTVCQNDLEWQNISTNSYYESQWVGWRRKTGV
jgi:hypothetical protein